MRQQPPAALDVLEVERFDRRAHVAQGDAQQRGRHAIAHQMKQRGYEIRGLGKEIWQDIDAQEYVNQMRDEWDKRR